MFEKVERGTKRIKTSFMKKQSTSVKPKPKKKVDPNDFEIIVKGLYRHKKTNKVYVYADWKYYELVGVKCEEVKLDESNVRVWKETEPA